MAFNLKKVARLEFVTDCHCVVFTCFTCAVPAGAPLQSGTKTKRHPKLSKLQNYYKKIINQTD